MFESGMPKRLTVRYLRGGQDLRMCLPSVEYEGLTCLEHLPCARFAVSFANSQAIAAHIHALGS
jgi:hypothetical protein